MNKRTRPYRDGYFIPSSHPRPQRVVLRRVDKTIWEATKDFINNLKINEKFTRKELLKDIYKTNISSEETTVDNYRNLLTKIKIVEHVGFGKYIKRYHIPKSLTTKQLQKLAYKKGWESWFTPVEMLNELMK